MYIDYYCKPSVACVPVPLMKKILTVGDYMTFLKVMRTKIVRLLFKTACQKTLNLFHRFVLEYIAFNIV